MNPSDPTAPKSKTVFVRVPQGSLAYRMRIAGVTILERVLWELARRGVTRALVALPETPLPRIPLEIEWVSPSTPVPDGMEEVQAAVIAGIAVSDEESRREAERRVVRSLRRSFEGPIDALINRRISAYCSLWLSRTSVAPNVVTVAAIAVGLVAIVLSAMGTVWTLAVAGILIQAQSVLDCCDGELARLTFKGSRLGQWLDNVSDDILDDLFLVAVGMGIGHETWMAAAILGAVSRAAAQIYQYREIYRRTGTGDVYAFRWWFEMDKETPEEVYAASNPLMWLRNLGRRDTYIFLWMVMSLIGCREAIVIHGAGLGFSFGALMMFDLVLKPRRLRNTRS